MVNPRARITLLEGYSGRRHADAIVVVLLFNDYFVNEIGVGSRAFELRRLVRLGICRCGWNDCDFLETLVERRHDWTR